MICMLFFLIQIYHLAFWLYSSVSIVVLLSLPYDAYPYIACIRLHLQILIYKS